MIGFLHSAPWRGRGVTRIGLLVAVAVAAAACSSGGSGSSTSTTAHTTGTLQVLVTNDDGVGAPGIDAAVQALRKLPQTHVTVVAPATNESGTGNEQTSGNLTVTDATTASGYAAKAVHGFPVDTIVWAIDDQGVSTRPNLVVSGINYGENVGPLANVSGTVGAARAALQRGIPALAVSQGVDDGVGPNFSQGAEQLTTWVQKNRDALLAPKSGGGLPEGNLNVPTCVGKKPRGPINAPQATSLTGINLGQVNCSSTATNPPNDAQAFVEGFAVVSPLGSSTPVTTTTAPSTTTTGSTTTTTVPRTTTTVPRTTTTGSTSTTTSSTTTTSTTTTTTTP